MKGNLCSEVLLRAETLIEDNFCYYRLTSGTRLQLVCQSMPAYSSTPYPNVRDYEGQTRLSPPTAYPSTVGYEANKGNM